MKKCPTCGFNNLDNRERCLKCSTALDSQAVPDGSHVADARPPAFQETLFGARRLVYTLGQKLQRELPLGVPRRFPWSAAYLAILPGVGQLYNHQKFRALIFALIWLGLLAFFLITFFQPWNNWVLLAFVLWIFYAMADAYSMAVRINGDRWTWRQVIAVWFSVMFYLGAFLFAGQFFGFGLFFLPTVKSPGLAPAFVPGDKLFVLGPPFMTSKLQRGSVVYYDPPRFTFTRTGGLTSDIYSLNEKNSFGVISAVEGESLDVADTGEIRVNGMIVLPHQLPLNPSGVPGPVRFDIPPGHYGILFSHRVIEQGFLSFLGGSYSGDMPTPRDAVRSGLLLELYDEVVQVPESEIEGIVLFRFHPPERRTWFGWNGGVWKELPSYWRTDGESLNDESAASP